MAYSVFLRVMLIITRAWGCSRLFDIIISRSFRKETPTGIEILILFSRLEIDHPRFYSHYLLNDLPNLFRIYSGRSFLHWLDSWVWFDLRHYLLNCAWTWLIQIRNSWRAMRHDSVLLCCFTDFKSCLSLSLCPFFQNEIWNWPKIRLTKASRTLLQGLLDLLLYQSWPCENLVVGVITPRPWSLI